jgi:tRNA(fMet)-specific endonuclease VapC
MNEVLLDTDIYSEIGRARNPIVAGHAAAYLAAQGRFTTSAVTIMEVVRGLRRKGSSRRLHGFLQHVAVQKVLPFDHVAAVLAGEVQGRLEAQGLPIGRSDPMIAAIALQHRMTLVTGNTAHFQRIQRLGYPLVLANWRV